MEAIPKDSALVIVPLDALKGIGGPTEKRPFWQSLFESEVLKVLGASVAAVVAAFWTVHLYMDDTWKESAKAITTVSRSLDEISFFCSGDENSIGVPEFKRLLVAKETGQKQDSKPADSNAAVASDLTLGLCAKAVFDARQNLAAARTRIVRPFRVSEPTWGEAWKSMVREIGTVTSTGIGSGGQRLKALEDAWRDLLTLAEG
jgi:hypothetical protein